jgi:hypothetical protein
VGAGWSAGTYTVVSTSLLLESSIASLRCGLRCWRSPVASPRRTVRVQGGPLLAARKWSGLPGSDPGTAGRYEPTEPGPVRTSGVGLILPGPCHPLVVHPTDPG